MSLSRRALLGAVVSTGAGALVGARTPARERVVDFHSHAFPPEYVETLRSSPGAVKVSENADGNLVIQYPCDSSVIVRGHRDIAFRESVLDQHGVDMQLLTFPNPGTHTEPPPRSLALARLVNDAFGAIVSKRPQRFAALATLPLNDPAASAAELDRAYRSLGLRGALLLSHVNGVPLSDERFWRLYEKADALEAILYVHPTFPVAAETMADFRMSALVGFPMDVTLAAARLVFSGVVERFPRITWVLGILGGAIPYLAERLDRGFQAFKECRAHITQPPSAYLRRFYYDTVNFDAHALQLAIQFAGVDRLLAGSDYPQQIGSLQLMQTSIRTLPIPEGDRARLLGGNAVRLLRL